MRKTSEGGRGGHGEGKRRGGRSGGKRGERVREDAKVCSLDLIT